MLEWTGETTTFKEIGEVDDNNNITPTEGDDKADKSAAQRIRENIDAADMQEVVEDMPFNDGLAAADNLGTDLKSVLSTPVREEGYRDNDKAEPDDDDEYQYNDDDAPPEDDDGNLGW